MPEPDPDHVYRVFAAVCDMADDERTAELRRQCGDDTGLLAAVERLLTADRSGTALGETRVAALRQALHDGDAAPDAALPATLGEYRIDGLLGRGGMGVVYRARQPQPERDVALKVLPPAASDAAVQRFALEAELLARLQHPGIAQIHAAGTFATEGGPRPYLAMELIDGTDLSRWCAAAMPDRRTRIEMLCAICDAMQHAHQKGVVHRDLKPGNVLVDGDGRPRVVDFGIARLVTEAPGTTLPGQLLGTLSYMSPEQADGDAALVDTRADIYALGVIGYELLSGALPIEPDTHSIVRSVRQLVEQPPVPLGQRDATLRGDLENIFACCLRKRPDDRYPSAAALADDLRRHLAHEPIHARPRSLAYTLSRFARRHRVAVAGAGLVVTSLAVGLWISISATRDARAAELRESHLRIEATELADANAALAAAEADQRRRAEANLARYDRLKNVVLLRRAEEAVDTTSPAWPSNLATIERWQQQLAQPVLDALDDLHAALQAVDARAAPRTAAAGRGTPEQDPRSLRMQALRRDVRHMQQVLARRRGGDAVAKVPLPPEAALLDTQRLRSYAYVRIAPATSRRTVLGEQPEGLAAAEQVVARVEAGDAAMPLCTAYELLSWARIANGMDDEAVAAAEAGLALASGSHRLLHVEQLARVRQTIADGTGAAGRMALARAEQEIAELEAELRRARALRFADSDDEFLRHTLAQLIGEIEAFERRDVAVVQRRADWANGLRELTLSHPNARATWAEAAAAIRAADGELASERYAEVPVELAPQWGLVPIGKNPATGLWEFYHLRSAWDPTAGVAPRDLPIPEHAADGTIDVGDTTGIVFVLVPGGTATIGAQSIDPDGPNHDPLARDGETPHEVTLAPYFIARHELTQGQFVRLSGQTNPSQYRAGFVIRPSPQQIELSNPVEQISWRDAHALLDRHGLVLPTEAQWEYACRAGTTTTWWTGAERDSLVVDGIAMNIADRTPAQYGLRWPACLEWATLDDGWMVHAPVGRLRANPFGLHDVYGNVWEWCRDRMGLYEMVAARAGDGYRDETDGTQRVRRGGCFSAPARVCRSAARDMQGEDERSHTMGVRAARPLLADDQVEASYGR